VDGKLTIGPFAGANSVASAQFLTLTSHQDPAGALIISCELHLFRACVSTSANLAPTYLSRRTVVLIFTWGSTCATHFQYLAGKAAPLDFQNLITYKAMTFADQIEAIDSCIVYHNGPRYVIEVDLVMKGETTLLVAHDV
jgi:hypothetical protein